MCIHRPKRAKNGWPLERNRGLVWRCLAQWNMSLDCRTWSLYLAPGVSAVLLMSAQISTILLLPGPKGSGKGALGRWLSEHGCERISKKKKKKFHLVTLSSDSTLQCCFPRGSKWTAAPNREKKLGSLQTVTKLHCSSYFSLAYYSDTAAKQDHLSCYLKVKLVISSRIAKTWMFANSLTEPSILSSIGRLNR